MDCVKLIWKAVRHRYFVLFICVLALLNIFFDVLRLDILELLFDAFILLLFLPIYIRQRKRHLRRGGKGL